MSVGVAVPVSCERPQIDLQMPGIEELLFSNLLLLGLDPETAERKYSCTISPEMFRTPNVKGMEAVLHFLLLKSSPDAKDVRLLAVLVDCSLCLPLK